MNFNKKIIDESLMGEKPIITDKIVDYYRRNPGELDLIIDKEYVYIKFLKFFFFVGIAITIISRVLMYFRSWGLPYSEAQSLLIFLKK